MAQFERVLEIRDRVQESPIWSEDEQKLYWIDWETRRLFRADPTSGPVETWQMPAAIGCLVLRRSGGCMVALDSGFYSFNPADGALACVARTHQGEQGLELNDGKCDRAGRFWAGSMQVPPREPKAALFRLDPDHSCHRMSFGLIIANGIAFSPDDRTLYYADSGTRRIMACDYDILSGTPGEPRIFAEIDRPGVPDGSTVDARGYLWNAEFNGGRITRYAPDGRVDRRIEVPVQQPTSCIFGGPDYRTLYVTTSRLKLSADQEQRQPLAGSILALDPGVPGLPEPSFAG
jgi:sugar lactone lactonase YvrE